MVTTEANSNGPKGAVEKDDKHWQVDANDQLRKAREYEPLVIHYNADNGAAVRLGDVAKVSDSVEDVRNAGFSDDLPAVLLIVTRQPGANIIEATDEAMVSGLAPGRLALTTMAGKSTLGSGATGSRPNDRVPASSNARVSSVVATGRRMKGVDRLIARRPRRTRPRCSGPARAACARPPSDGPGGQSRDRSPGW